ncbi:dynein heavy chain [Corchorus olitorius]|uniref:Dynein heavy chain n=1 Tax=Corchorus olitorius TaxID=93759 RepID=A0A1R3KA64_9ROSI|nr:dynein heavy chain [Corchorus olitorius]
METGKEPVYGFERTKLESASIWEWQKELPWSFIGSASRPNSPWDSNTML